MNTADTRALQDMMIVAADAIVAAEPELTRVDMVIGDGDHGIGMKNGFSALKRMLQEERYSNPYELFHACGLCLIKSMGGSSGVLFGTLFVGGLDAIQGLSALDGRSFCAFLFGGIEAVIRRGKAKAGDKTMVDALLVAKSRMEEILPVNQDICEILTAAEQGALEGMEATKAMLPRLGRSKNFRETALGWPDPGAVSVSVLFGGMRKAFSA